MLHIPTSLANSSDQPNASGAISRRKVLSTLTATSAVICASSLPATAGIFGKSNNLPIVKVKSGSRVTRAKQSQSVGGFPAEWTRLHGQNVQQYAEYLNSLKLQNISAQDVISAHAKKRGTTWNILPPRKWWTRMGYTLRVVDRISSTMDIPVKSVVSAYRCPRYNALCGGKKRSWHQANVALDVQFETRARNVTLAARNLRDRGLFKGGVGSYSSFTHVDTRGQNVNW